MLLSSSLLFCFIGSLLPAVTSGKAIVRDFKDYEQSDPSETGPALLDDAVQSPHATSVPLFKAEKRSSSNFGTLDARTPDNSAQDGIVGALTANSTIRTSLLGNATDTISYKGNPDFKLPGQYDVATLLQLDKTCAQQAQALTIDDTFFGRYPPRSVALEKRARPSEVLFQLGRAVVVGTGSAVFQPWTAPSVPIGTAALCGCTALLLVNDIGATVAHIRPDPRTITAQLDQIRTLYNHHMRGDPSPVRVFIIEPTFLGVVELEHVQHQIATFLGSQLRVSVQTEYYPVTQHGGTLLVNKVASSVKAWLNDQLITL